MLATTLRPPGLTRSRVLLALIIGLGCWLAVSRVHPAGAFAEWCFDDPVVSINGVQLSTQIGAYGDPSIVPTKVKSASVTYYIPGGVSYKLISDTNKYMHEKVYWSVSKTKWTPGTPLVITVTVQFSSSASYQAQMLNVKGTTTLATANGYMATGLTSQFAVQ